MHCAQTLTPHGRRTVDLGQVKLRLANTRRAAAGPAPVNKWQVYRDVCCASNLLGLRDRALAVLNALLSFYPEQEITGPSPIVFPSNEQISARAHGISGATLRRAITALVEAGLIDRNDSPNGKRYVRRNAAGEIQRAFGFALTPLIVRAQELAAMARSVRQEAEMLSQTREAFSLCRRDARKLIVAAIEQGGEGNWRDLLDRFQTIVGKLSRKPAIDELRAALAAMTALRDLVIKSLENNTNAAKMSGSDRQDERHKESHNTESYKENSERISQDLKAQAGSPEVDEPRRSASLPPLDMVLQACPQIVSYAKGQDIQTWRELFIAATLASQMLGVSRDAWIEACNAMGPEAAAASLAHILERQETICNPGGYLRSLSKRACAEAYDPCDMIMALLAQRAVGMATPADDQTARMSGPEISCPVGLPTRKLQHLPRNRASAPAHNPRSYHGRLSGSPLAAW